jgi:hypothetical protein
MDVVATEPLAEGCTIPPLANEGEGPMKRALVVLAGVVLGALVLAPQAGADLFRVTRTNDPAPNGCKPRDCSLREAVIKANTTEAADTIALKANSYRVSRDGIDEASEVGDLDVTEPLRIRGAGLGQIAIEGQWTGLPHRLIEVKDNAKLVATGITLRDGGDEEGLGAALYVPESGSAVLRNARVISNESQYGAVENDGGSFKATRVIFSRNRASCCPAFYNENGGVAALSKVAFVRNAAEDDTGAIYSDGERLTIRDSLFERNTAGDVGGAIIASLGQLNVFNSTFSGNRTTEDGAGIYVEQSNILLNNVTLTKNVADADGDDSGNGGGLYDSGGTNTEIVMSNSIIAGNLDLSGEAPDCDANSGDVFTSLGFNLIGKGLGCGYVRPDSDMVGVRSGLARLRDNGGFTKTHALKASSKAVDKGSRAKPGSANPTACEERDQRGVKRPQGKRCDIGAYERK